MKHLTIPIMLCFGLVCYASPKPKDTIYSNIETLMKEVRTTKKKKATYFLVLKEGGEDEVKVRIDLQQIDCEIPLYKSTTFDFKKLLALKDESLTEPKQKLDAFDTKSREKIKLEKELSQLNAGLEKLMVVDSLSRDSLAIDSVQKLKDQKVVEVSNKKKEATSLYKEYDSMMDSLLGNLRTNYKQRLTAAIEEAYQKIENEDTEFASVDDDATFWDIRLDLLKVDATREMLVPRRVNNQNKIEKVTAGKQYYVLHFAEFGTMFEKEKVKKVFSAIKLWEFHLNPYLVDKQFGLVCDDQDRTQHYINSIVDYKSYSGSLVEEEEYDTGTQWISQYDCEKIKEITGINCRCVAVGSSPGNNCCNQTCRAILKNKGAELTGERIIIVDTDVDDNCKTTSNLGNYQKGMEHLNLSLSKGLPVLVGVQKLSLNDRGIWNFACASYNNNPKSANHYLVIVSRKGNQYRYFEVGTQHEFKGKLETNVFEDLGTRMESKEIDEKKYRITDIRVNKLD